MLPDAAAGNVTPGGNVLETDAGLVVLVSGDTLGGGDEDLGRLLMPRFLHELGGAKRKPGIVVFLNTGVRLVADDSPVLGQLQRLERQGVELKACSTCLARFDLTDRVAIGSKTDMSDIVSTLMAADSVTTV